MTSTLRTLCIILVLSILLTPDSRIYASMEETIASSPISRAEIINRAQSWVDAGVSYNQQAYYQGYRTDCSGYVSFAWRLTTSSGQPESRSTVTLDYISYQITKEQLLAGDILNDNDAGNGGHVVLFHQWANTEKTQYWGYDLTPSGTRYRIIAYPYSSHPEDFVPRRYNNVIDEVLPSYQNLIENSSFDDDFSNWWTWAEVDYAIYDNVLHFKRRSDSPNGAAVGQSRPFWVVPTGTPFEITVKLGNVSGATKYLSVSLRNTSDWNGAFTCNFTIHPYQPLRQYLVRGKSGVPWTGIQYEVHVGPADSIPDATMDDVIVQYRPDINPSGTECLLPNQAPNKPALISPANDVVIGSKTLTLTWSPGSDDGNPNPNPDYWVQVDNNSDFSSPELEIGWGYTGTSWNITVPNNGEYYWRVNQGDGDLNSDWSATYSFKVLAPCSTCGPAQSSWPMYRHDLTHSGRSTSVGPAMPIIDWKFNSDTGLGSNPAIGNGIVYAAINNYLYIILGKQIPPALFSADGNVRNPTLGKDGLIYFGTDQGSIYAVAKQWSEMEGIWRIQLRWKFSTGGWITAAPTLDPYNEVLYVGSSDGYFYALNQDGTLKWRYSVGSWIQSSAAIGSDGTIYFGSTTSKVYALNPNGTLKWEYTTGSYIDSSPAIGADGTIYIGSVDHYLYVLNGDNGSLKWRYQTGDAIYASSAVGADGSIYIGSTDDYLYAFWPNGSLRWRYKTEGDVHTPMIDADGTIYAGSNDGNLYAINPNGTIKWRIFLDGWISYGPILSDNGTIYVETISGELYAIQNAKNLIYLPILVR